MCLLGSLTINRRVNEEREKWWCLHGRKSRKVNVFFTVTVIPHNVGGG